MINTKSMLASFVDRPGWSKIDGLPGNFSVSPDTGDYRRVFSSDIKVRQSGKMLLGVIGIYYPSCGLPDSANNLGLSAYITNFKDFSSPPILTSNETLNSWVDQICLGVLSLPSDPNLLLSATTKGRLGRFDLETFLRSTPWGEEFLGSL